MPSELYVGNTDNSWFDFLARNQPLSEINFWKPSKQLFKAVEEGSRFVFRLKSPRNAIGGYGILAASGNATIQQCWDDLGISNGVASKEEMISSIAKYRKSRGTDKFSQIGFRILIDPVFFTEDQWFDVPNDWSNNIVTGKVYSETSREGGRIVELLDERTDRKKLFARDRHQFEGFSDNSQERFGAPRLQLPRLGQRTFRLAVLGAFSGKCAVTETGISDTLEAAHIVKYSADGLHTIQNGLLLRKDIHSLFDVGLISIGEDLKLLVSDRLREISGTDRTYTHLHGKKLRVPDNPLHVPDPKNLAWHRKNVFLGCMA